MYGNIRQEAAAVSVMQTAETGEQALRVNLYGRDGTGYRSGAFWHTEEEKAYVLFLPDWVYGEQGEAILSFFKEVEMDRLSKLPSIYIDTESGSMEGIKADKRYRESVRVAVLDETGNGEADLTGKIKCRGNASFTYAEKKSYEIEFDTDTDLYGMGAAGNWILLANYFDSTYLAPLYLRNSITFYMAERMGMEGTPEFCQVDVFADGEYQGIYLLCEKVEIHEQRLNIHNLEAEQGVMSHKEVAGRAKFAVLSEDGESVIRKGFRWEKEPENISGGYLLELESIPSRYEEEESGFISDGGQMAVLKNPKHASAAQVEYISRFYQKFEDALRSEEEPGAFLEYIDLESFVKKYLIEETVKNKDASVSSL